MAIDQRHTTVTFVLKSHFLQTKTKKRSNKGSIKKLICNFVASLELVLSVRMNSVLDGIGTDSDTSAASGDGEPKVKRRAISLKVVVVLKP